MIKSNNKSFRKSLWGLAIFAMLVFVFVFFFLEGIVINRLENKLQNSYGNTYNVSYKTIDYNVSFTSLSIRLTDVKIETDTLKAQEFKSPILEIESESINVNGVSLWNFFVYSELSLNDIAIESPKVAIAENKDFESEKQSNVSEDQLDFSKYIKSLSFDEFTITNGSAVFYRDVKMSDTLFRLNELDFKALEFKSIDENLSELLIIDKYKGLSIVSKSFKLNLGEDSYTIYVEKFKGELINGNLVLENIHFDPPNERIRSGKEYRSDVKITRLELFGVEHIMGENLNLSADTAIILDTHIDLTKNQALSKKREKILWMENLLSLKNQLSIKHLKFRNCSVTSEILKLDGNKKYVLELTDVHGSIKNINTKGESDSLTLELNSNVFKSGELKMNVSFPYNNPETSLFEGTISNIDLKSFNDLLVRMYSLKIEKGKLSTLAFKGRTDGNISNGKLTFEYEDLEGSFFKENNGKKKRAKLISSFMNYVIHSSNPRKNESIPQEVDFSFTKDNNQGQIMLWLGGILDGTIITLIGEKKHDFIEKQMAD